MKRMMKKFVSCAVAVILVFALTTSGLIAANAIAADAPAQGNGYATDFNAVANKWYELDIAPQSKCVITFSAPSDCFYVEYKHNCPGAYAYSCAGKLTKGSRTLYETSLLEPTKEYASPKQAYASGTTVKFTFDNLGKSQGATDGVAHVKICFTTVKYSNFEKENNNSKKKARSIGKKKIYHGLLNDKSDADWYCFRAPAKGKFKIQVRIDEIPEQASAYIKVNKNGCSAYKKFSTPLIMKAKKGKKLYIKVWGADPTTFYPNGAQIVYSLRVMKGK